jgi:hypothetical protein
MNLAISGGGWRWDTDGRGFNPFRIARPPLGGGLVPTTLAHLSVKGHGPAIAALVSAYGVIAPGFVGASLVGSGTGDADTGIVGVCLCWWNAEGYQRYGCCRRRAHYCPLHVTPLWPPCVATSRVVQNYCRSVPKAYEFAGRLLSFAQRRNALPRSVPYARSPVDTEARIQNQA